jgi:hypothetical protein
MIAIVDGSTAGVLAGASGSTSMFPPIAAATDAKASHKAPSKRPV